MAIIVNLDVMMAKRKIALGDLADRIGITPANLSILKTGKAKAIRFSTLEAICKELNCQPADILEFKDEDRDIQGMADNVLTICKCVEGVKVYENFNIVK